MKIQSRKLKTSYLNVIAIDEANVREVEPNGQVLRDLRFIGKAFNSETQEFEVIDGGVRVPYSSHVIAKLIEKTLLPADAETAKAANVPYKQ